MEQWPPKPTHLPAEPQKEKTRINKIAAGALLASSLGLVTELLMLLPLFYYFRVSEDLGPMFRLDGVYHIRYEVWAACITLFCVMGGVLCLLSLKTLLGKAAIVVLVIALYLRFTVWQQYFGSPA